MDAQAINLGMFVILLAAAAFWVCIYFSRPLLRWLSAWAEGRAAAIDHAVRVAAQARRRLGVDTRADREALAEAAE